MNALSRAAVGVVAVAAIAVTGTTVHSHARAVATPRAGVAPVVATSAVCPSVTGGAAGSSTDMTVATVRGSTVPHVSAAPLLPFVGKARSLVPKPAAIVHQSTPYAAVDVEATGAGAAETVASQVALRPGGYLRALTDVACTAPGTDWWFAGADGRIGVTDVLQIANPTDAQAVVQVSLWSARGSLSPPGTSGVIIAPHTSLLRPVADIAPDVAGIALHVHAETGTVTAAVLDQHTSGIRPVGTDWIAPTSAPATRSVVTGFAAGATTDLLHIANPGDRDATVSLRVVTPTKNFQPAGHESVVVAAGHTVAVDLAGAIAGEAAAVTMSSDQPVVAEGMTLIRPTTGFSELAWVAAQQPLRTPAGIAANSAPFGQDVTLVLTAPQGATRVRVSTPGGASATVSVDAGRTKTVDLRSLLHAGGNGPGPVLLTPVGPEPLYVVRLLHAVGAHGPLLAAEAPTVLPLPTTLPAVIADLRAATR